MEIMRKREMYKEREIDTQRKIKGKREKERMKKMK